MEPHRDQTSPWLLLSRQGMRRVPSVPATIRPAYNGGYVRFSGGIGLIFQNFPQELCCTRSCSSIGEPSLQQIREDNAKKSETLLPRGSGSQQQREHSRRETPLNLSIGGP